MTQISKIRVGASLVAMLLLPALVQANSVSYFLNDTNVSQFSGGLPDGTDYLKVTIDDEGALGLINFTVDVISGALTPTNNYGIQDFAFNITDDLFTPTASNFTLPAGWSLNAVNSGPNIGDAKPTNADGYGKFDVRVSDGGLNRHDPLIFSIAVDGDTINSYFGLSDPTLGQTQPNVAFSAHVTGINTGAYTYNADSSAAECNPDTDGPTCMELPSAWFGGPVAVVPIPAAVWLFGSGLIGLIGFARRKVHV